MRDESDRIAHPLWWIEHKAVRFLAGDVDEVKVSDVAKAIMNEISGDEAFMVALANKTAYSTVYEIVRRLVAETRRMKPVQEAATLAGMKNVPPINLPEIIAKHKAKNRADFSLWMEHVGDRHVPFMKLNSELLEVAITERKKNNWSNAATVALMEHIKPTLEPGQEVGDKYQPDELSELFEQKKKETNTWECSGTA